MARKKRKTPSINGSSSADIAFMLLIFFLITTSMDTDKGLPRRLPAPAPEDQQEQKLDVNRRNTLRVIVNSENLILCQGEVMTIEQLKAKVKEFIENPQDDPNLPEKIEEDLPYFGKVRITKKHVISLQNTVDTQYQAYISVQNALAAAYNELREDLAMRKFGKHFADLDDDRKAAIVSYYKQVISEAEPKDYSKKKK